MALAHVQRPWGIFLGAHRGEVDDHDQVALTGVRVSSGVLVDADHCAAVDPVRFVDQATSLSNARGVPADPEMVSDPLDYKVFHQSAVVAHRSASWDSFERGPPLGICPVVRYEHFPRIGSYPRGPATVVGCIPKARARAACPRPRATPIGPRGAGANRSFGDTALDQRPIHFERQACIE